MLEERHQTSEKLQLEEKSCYKSSKHTDDDDDDDGTANEIKILSYWTRRTDQWEFLLADRVT